MRILFSPRPAGRSGWVWPFGSPVRCSSSPGWSGCSPGFAVRTAKGKRRQECSLMETGVAKLHAHFSLLTKYKDDFKNVHYMNLESRTFNILGYFILFSSSYWCLIPRHHPQIHYFHFYNIKNTMTAWVKVVSLSHLTKISLHVRGRWLLLRHGSCVTVS